MAIKAGVKVNCRRCGKPADSSEMRLDHVFKAVVCAACVKERQTPKKPQPELPSRPKDWDEDDEELERLARKQSAKQAVTAVPIDDAHLKVTCPKCSYKFKYDKYEHNPASCPYCGKPINPVKGR